MIMKRATQKLRDAGIEGLQVLKGGGGYYLFDPALRKQQAHWYDNPDDVIAVAIDGERPEELKSIEEVI